MDMAGRLRIVFGGAIHNVTFRGNGRGELPREISPFGRKYSNQGLSLIPSWICGGKEGT